MSEKWYFDQAVSAHNDPGADGGYAIAAGLLAVAEAIHLLTEAVGSRPVEIVSNGSVTLDPEAVAQTVSRILGKDKP